MNEEVTCLAQMLSLTSGLADLGLEIESVNIRNQSGYNVHDTMEENCKKQKGN